MSQATGERGGKTDVNHGGIMDYQNVINVTDLTVTGSLSEYC
jgi:hypothetical protein